ncbi:MAG: 16S rRNA (adenine(1518)-N(6)/adenine(1519)-N(6))-dimethyltransferase RsmA [Candidatus Omnitrophota bacterium]
MLRLTEIKAILKMENIRPAKRLGQNFLIDQNIKNKIINSIELNRDDTVLEIGPGLGALTEDLCGMANKVIAVEKDTRLYNFLKERVPFDNLELINTDILKYEFRDLASKIKIAGNLPYCISSPILNHLIENKNEIDTVYATVQREFAERVVAGPGTKDYGSLSCYAQFYAEPKILFNIPRGAFFPAPEVDSCFLRITMRGEKRFDVDEKLFFKIVRSAFEKRRKTMENSLYSAGLFPSKAKVSEALEKAGIPASARPEALSLKQFFLLTQALRDDII